MKWFKYMLIVLVLAGCALLKNTQKTTGDDAESATMDSGGKSSSETQSTTNDQQIMLRRDDSKSDYTISFWPRGELKFLPEGGFTGAFDSVRLKGSLHKISGSLESSNAESRVKQKNASETYDKAKTSSRKRSVSKSSAPNIKAVLVVLLVLAGVLVVVISVKKST